MNIEYKLKKMSIVDFEIEFEMDESKTSSIILIYKTEKAGVLTFNLKQSGIMEIIHTEVNSKFAGNGFGKILVKEAANFARNNSIKINPVCNYAKKILGSEKEYVDVLV